MTGNVEYLDVPSRLDIPAERVLEWAGQANLKSVVVVGYDEDGEFYFASSYAGGPDALWLMEIAKKKLLEISDGGGE